MRSSRKLLLLTIPGVLLFAADPSWKNKSVSEWTEAETKEILTDSPWTKSLIAIVGKNNDAGQSGGGMNRRGGFGVGGVGVGLPGMGGGGMGRRGGGGGGGGGGRQSTDPIYSEPPQLTLRWESALPVREAELKARETDAPTLDEDHYAIAVYGIPRRLANDDSQRMADQLKKQASLKRDGKKDIKPSSVEILEREDGPVIVYLFPRTKEITKEDRRLEFDGKVGRIEFTQAFYIEDMVYQSKLEL